MFRSPQNQDLFLNENSMHFEQFLIYGALSPYFYKTVFTRSDTVFLCSVDTNGDMETTLAQYILAMSYICSMK